MGTTLRSITSLLAATVLIATQAQNLVPNPGFEVQTDCPEPDDIDFAPPWNTASTGTPDLFDSTCPSQNHPGHTGSGNAGVFVFGPFVNYREYMQAPLTSALTAGQGYCVSAWVQRAGFQLGSDRFGFHFANSSVMGTNSLVMNLVPQVENAPGNVLGGNTWQQVSGGFIATGGEQWIVIGSFANDAATEIDTITPSSPYSSSYYYVDDVAVVACDNIGIPEAALASFEVFPQPASDRLTILGPRGGDVPEVRLFDGRGSLVRSHGPLRAGGDGLVLDVASLPEGLYQLQLISPSGSHARPVLVAR